MKPTNICNGFLNRTISCWHRCCKTRVGPTRGPTTRSNNEKVVNSRSKIGITSNTFADSKMSPLLFLRFCPANSFLVEFELPNLFRLFNYLFCRFPQNSQNEMSFLRFVLQRFLLMLSIIILLCLSMIMFFWLFLLLLLSLLLLSMFFFFELLFLFVLSVLKIDTRCSRRKLYVTLCAYSSWDPCSRPVQKHVRPFQIRSMTFGHRARGIFALYLLSSSWPVWPTRHRPVQL